MVTRVIKRITAVETAAANAKASPSKMVQSVRNTFTKEISSSTQSDMLTGCELKHSKTMVEGNHDPPKEGVAKKRDVPTEEPTSNKKSKKRRGSNSFTINLSDVPPQSPILRDKADGQKKGYTSKYTGVSWKQNRKKWVAMIHLEGKVRHIGCYENEEDAGTDFARAVYKYRDKETLEKLKSVRGQTHSPSI